MRDLEIKGFIPSTMLDWEGMLASTLFLPRCNFRCPYCQNPDLVLRPERLETVSFDIVREYLRSRGDWIEGVCITGGEPCLHADLPGLCADIRAEGVRVKLDTNGSIPGMLESLIDSGLVDFIAMDVKAPLDATRYRLASGCDLPDLLDLVGRSIEEIASSGVEHEFRTTVVPMLHTPEDVGMIARALAGEERYALQQFSPRETLDVRFAGLRPFTGDDMEAMLEHARRYVPGTQVRGAPTGFEL